MSITGITGHERKREPAGVLAEYKIIRCTFHVGMTNKSLITQQCRFCSTWFRISQFSNFPDLTFIKAQFSSAW